MFVLCRVCILGTIWDLSSPIAGADEGVAALQQHGKRIVYLSNNAVRSAEKYEAKFKESNIPATFVSSAKHVVLIGTIRTTKKTKCDRKGAT